MWDSASRKTRRLLPFEICSVDKLLIKTSIKPFHFTYFLISNKISGILLNSLMTILSFNHVDFGLMFGKVKEEDKQARMHLSKFLRQCAYNVVIVAVNLG